MAEKTIAVTQDDADRLAGIAGELEHLPVEIRRHFDQDGRDARYLRLLQKRITTALASNPSTGSGRDRESSGVDVSQHPIVRELRGYGAEHDALELEAKLRAQQQPSASQSKPEVWTIYSPTQDGVGGYVALHGDYRADLPGAILTHYAPPSQPEPVRDGEPERPKEKWEKVTVADLCEGDTIRMDLVVNNDDGYKWCRAEVLKVGADTVEVEFYDGERSKRRKAATTRTERLISAQPEPDSEGE